MEKRKFSKLKFRNVARWPSFQFAILTLQFAMAALIAIETP